MSTMIAKFYVTEVTKPYEGAEQINMSAVSDKPFDAEGKSDDNTFARWSPMGSFSITNQNPNLFGKFAPGQKYYLNFTRADS
jgi:hypothetical protein